MIEKKYEEEGQAILRSRFAAEAEHPSGCGAGEDRQAHGWHTFRRTFTPLLKANGEDVKVVQELLRHATVKMTLEVYAQAVTPAKREAQPKVAGLLGSK